MMKKRVLILTRARWYFALAWIVAVGVAAAWMAWPRCQSWALNIQLGMLVGVAALPIQFSTEERE